MRREMGMTRVSWWRCMYRALVAASVFSHVLFQHRATAFQQVRGSLLRSRKSQHRRRCCVLAAHRDEVSGLSPEFNLAVLGDLHLDRNDMKLHEEGREQIKQHLSSLQSTRPGSTNHLISLGDLGAYGEAGTTHSFLLAREYLGGFNTPYNLVAGNHDLEGMEEFETDEENLRAWMNHFNLQDPQFCTRVGDRTLCVGLSTVRFRSAEFSSHEVHIDGAQIQWLDDLLHKHPESDGWRVLVFTHAPPLGCGLRVLQSVHVKNGCAWLNHSGQDEERRVFLRLCQKHHQIKAWFSGHFHLSHDYQDSISSAHGTAFVQTGVIGAKSCRDGRRQSRIVMGDNESLKVYTVNHHKDGDLRLDVTITYKPGGEDVVEAHGHDDFDHDMWFAARTPQKEDGCYVEDPDGVLSLAGPDRVDRVCWWHMADGKVLGVHDGLVVEYDSETLSPLGVVVDRDQLKGREVAVVGNGRALMLCPSIEGLGDADPTDVEIVHPNPDGSYWRKFQRNKLLRHREKEREKLAAEWLRRYKEVELKADKQRV